MRKGSKMTEEQKTNVRDRHLGLRYLNRKRPPPVSIETREKLRKRLLGNTNTPIGTIPWNKGNKKEYTEEEIKKAKTKKSIHNSMLLQKKQEEQARRGKPEQCETCGAFGKDLKKRLCFDHDHSTGKFRGWICQRCNLVLGHVKDSTDLLNNLIKYLEQD